MADKEESAAVEAFGQTAVFAIFAMELIVRNLEDVEGFDTRALLGHLRAAADTAPPNAQLAAKMLRGLADRLALPGPTQPLN